MAEMSETDSSPANLETASPWVTEWTTWWNGLSGFSKYGIGAFVLAWWSTLHFAFHALGTDHLAFGVILSTLYYGGPRLRPLFGFLVPILLTGIVYDSQRYYSDLIRGPIHVTEPYRFDKFFFGIPTANGVLTPNEYWQLHTHPVLDVVTGFFYLTFIAIFVSIAGWFRFRVSRQSSDVALRAPRMMWAFFWLNVIGYSTYYWYAAAPPWYVTLYGLGPADLSALPNPAGCIRFDQILGTHFFTGMYGKSADVFGAIPSLHIAYPLLAVLYSFQFKRLRAFSVCFYAIMCFSAVYLNHHYVLDLIWGSVYAVLVWRGLDWYFSRQASPSRA